MLLNSQPLSESQIRALAPSVFASAPHGRVSGRYQFFPTAAMLEGLALHGWRPVSAMESRVRLPDRRGYTRHLVRCRQIERPLPQVGDTVPEIVLLNSHDGSCSYQLHAGLFRFVCSNGLIISSAKMGLIRQRHSGDVVSRVIEGAYEIVERLPRIAEKVDTFRELELSPREQEAYAASASLVRWGEHPPVTPEALLEARRSRDGGDDLWTVYQRVQENLIRGGVPGRTRSGKRMSTRAVRSVDGNIALNRALWALTERMAELKAA